MTCMAPQYPPKNAVKPPPPPPPPPKKSIKEDVTIDDLISWIKRRLS